MPIKRTVLLSAAVAAVGAGGGAVALAASNANDDHRQAEQAVLTDAAKRLNVSPDALRSALGAAEDAQLDQAVKDGRLTQQQADAIKARRQQDGSVLGGPGLGHGPGGAGGPGWPGGPGFGHGPGGGPFDRGAVLDAAAKALGLSSADLRTQLRAGKSLADVAKARGKDIADVKAAISAAVAKDLDQAVTDKRLTDAQRDRILADFRAHLDDLVQRTGPDGPPAGGPGGPPPGPGGGHRGHWR